MSSQCQSLNVHISSPGILSPIYRVKVAVESSALVAFNPRQLRDQRAQESCVEIQCDEREVVIQSCILWMVGIVRCKCNAPAKLWVISCPTDRLG